MFRFESPQYLYFLIVIPVLVLLYLFWRIQRRHRMKKLGDLALLKALMPDVSQWRPFIKFMLCLLALTALIITLARPQMGLRSVSEERRGIEVMVALDVSNSMDLLCLPVTRLYSFLSRVTLFPPKCSLMPFHPKWLERKAQTLARPSGLR